MRNIERALELQRVSCFVPIYHARCFTVFRRDRLPALLYPYNTLPAIVAVVVLSVSHLEVAVPLLMININS